MYKGGTDKNMIVIHTKKVCHRDLEIDLLAASVLVDYVGIF